ncbi:Cytochrome P450 81D11 [Senna tora]|uniref:Cytochrome P450 81D11 n=1 Tax=Senna tora TaxID=362788 RepID=A0A834U1V6_9FABA|nr:Cytochrome P450 81D11 [Senna tora]
MDNLDTVIVSRGRSSSCGESLILDSAGSGRGVIGGHSAIALGENGGRREGLDQAIDDGITGALGGGPYSERNKFAWLVLIELWLSFHHRWSRVLVRYGCRRDIRVGPLSSYGEAQAHPLDIDEESLKLRSASMAASLCLIHPIIALFLLHSLSLPSTFSSLLDDSTDLPMPIPLLKPLCFDVVIGEKQRISMFLRQHSFDQRHVLPLIVSLSLILIKEALKKIILHHHRLLHPLYQYSKGINPLKYWEKVKHTEIKKVHKSVSGLHLGPPSSSALIEQLLQQNQDYALTCGAGQGESAGGGKLLIDDEGVDSTNAKGHDWAVGLGEFVDASVNGLIQEMKMAYDRQGGWSRWSEFAFTVSSRK